MVAVPGAFVQRCIPVGHPGGVSSFEGQPGPYFCPGGDDHAGVPDLCFGVPAGFRGGVRQASQRVVFALEFAFYGGGFVSAGLRRVVPGGIGGGGTGRVGLVGAAPRGLADDTFRFRGTAWPGAVHLSGGGQSGQFVRTVVGGADHCSLRSALHRGIRRGGSGGDAAQAAAGAVVRAGDRGKGAEGETSGRTSPKRLFARENRLCLFGAVAAGLFQVRVYGLLDQFLHVLPDGQV